MLQERHHREAGKGRVSSTESVWAESALGQTAERCRGGCELGSGGLLELCSWNTPTAAVPFLETANLSLNMKYF